MQICPIVHMDRSGERLLDLRPLGVDCIPVLGRSDFHMVHPGTDYHIHPKCVEICLCIRGNLVFETEDKSYPFLPGSVFVSTESEPHRMRHNPKGLIIYHILFAVPRRGKRMLGLTLPETEWITRSLVTLPHRLFRSTPLVRDSFERLFAAYDGETRPHVRSIRMKTATADLLMSVIDAAGLKPAKPPNRIAGIIREMQLHPDRDYPISRLAQSASLSTTAFSEAFKQAAGLPPHAYLLSCRISRSRQLLRQDKLSVGAVAGLLRFVSHQHFASTFKRIVGMSPTDFIRLSGSCRKGRRNRS